MPPGARSTKGLGDLLPDYATCPHCNYSLTGLRAGGRCPECGTPIAFRSRRHRNDDQLTDAYPTYLKTLALGCWLMFAGALASTLLFLVLRARPDPVVAGAGTLAGIAWWAGVWIVTRPRQTPSLPGAEAESEWRRCRWVARVSQLGWALGALGVCGSMIATKAAMAAAISNGMAYSPTATVRAFDSLVGLGNFAGLAGLVPLCVVVASLADWAGHTSLGDRYRTSAYMITLGTLGIAATIPVIAARKTALFGPAAFVAYTIAVLSYLSFLGGVLALLLSLARLATMSLWAINNADTRAESERRIAERRHRFAEEIAARSARGGASPAPPPVNPVQGPGAGDAPGGGDREIYALEPEEPPRG